MIVLQHVNKLGGYSFIGVVTFLILKIGKEE